ncbi:MAG: hypothetical protein QOJ40_2708 [Verrucomicrobiota bacterium]
MNQMVFCIDGYDDDAREIHISEIRRFLFSLSQCMALLVLFLQPGWGDVKAMVFYCLPSITAMKVDGADRVALTHDPIEILSFVKNDLGPMNSICERAEMFEEWIYGRPKQVFEYFGPGFNSRSLGSS